MIFLGGSCNPTTWRADIAIPALEAADVFYYNPQVENWRPELVEIEARAKAKADVLLFVIDGRTRAVVVVGWIEATEYMCTGREVWLVVQNIPDGTEIAGAVVTGRELKDLNNAREYFRDVARRHGFPLYENVEDVVRNLILAKVRS